MGKERKSTHPSSFCNLVNGLAELEFIGGLVEVAGVAAAAPPPPRKGFAMRPKLNGDDPVAFCARANCQRITWRDSQQSYLAPDQAALSLAEVEPQTSGSAGPSDDRRLGAKSQDSGYAHSARATFARRYQLLSSERNSGQQARNTELSVRGRHIL